MLHRQLRCLLITAASCLSSRALAVRSSIRPSPRFSAGSFLATWTECQYVHWRDSRLEWPIRHGFVDLVAREFHAGKMMFPPDAS